MNDVIINKIQSIQRCIQRAKEIYKNNVESFLDDYDLQDAAVLNIVRACDLSIDLANHIVKLYKMGIPTASAESFELLLRKRVITKDLCESLKRMVGFRNIVVHEYKTIDYNIVISVITKDLNELTGFTESVMDFAEGNPT
jgi:uncharacterized protein YutE (UPF0331/DUF86 family)